MASRIRRILCGSRASTRQHPGARFNCEYVMVAFVLILTLHMHGLLKVMQAVLGTQV